MSFPLSIPYLTNCINFIFVNVSLIKLKVQLCFHFSVHLDNIQLHQTWLIIISTTTLQTSLLQSMSGSLPSSYSRSTKSVDGLPLFRTPKITSIFNLWANTKRRLTRTASLKRCHPWWRLGRALWLIERRLLRWHLWRRVILLRVLSVGLEVLADCLNGILAQIW